ncbi:hypothetical protein [Jiangella sp. DSM 45060]|uniref:hypothetical protein n=1 Tax=Jiangella sp. DSM 45060 TaxID=1798224 RepID=UPI0012FE0CD0|nr:hypothetical protein [Jiangella sp. DSM 45060]
MLLREPDRLVAARTTWAPAVLKAPSTLTILVVFVALQFMIPARLVIGGWGPSDARLSP